MMMMVIVIMMEMTLLVVKKNSTSSSWLGKTSFLGKIIVALCWLGKVLECLLAGRVEFFFFPSSSLTALDSGFDQSGRGFYGDHVIKLDAGLETLIQVGRSLIIERRTARE